VSCPYRKIVEHPTGKTATPETACLPDPHWEAGRLRRPEGRLEEQVTNTEAWQFSPRAPDTPRPAGPIDQVAAVVPNIRAGDPTLELPMALWPANQRLTRFR
jgi:hypothetical protein